MDSIVKYAFESGALNNIILSVLLIWIMFFVTRHWWPHRTEHNERQQEIDKELRHKEIELDAEIRKLQIQGQIDVYSRVIDGMDTIEKSVEGLSATFNDFLQNVLSQFMEDRRDLIDTGMFKSKDRPK